MYRIIRILFLLGFAIFFVNTANAWTYPIKNIVKDTCNLNDIESCYSSLPIIKDAQYQNYKSDQQYRQIYTVLWGANYQETWNIGIGSHQGVDIATAEGTRVYAIGSGTVIEARYMGGRGNVITIEHTIKGKKIYSTYAHLFMLGVKKGDIVKEGEIIGQVGKTGNSTGPHLHFQIEINQDSNHPFFYTNCYGTIIDIVNLGLCQNQMYLYTIDPILFLEKNGAVNLTISENNIKSTIFGFNDLVLSGFVGGILDISQVATIDFSVRGLSSSDIAILSGTVKIVADEKFLQLLPSSFEVVYGTKKVFLMPKKAGWTTLQILYANKIKKTLPIFIQDSTNRLAPVSKMLLVKDKKVYNGYYGIFNLGIANLGNSGLQSSGFSLFADVNTTIVSARDSKQKLGLWLNTKFTTGTNFFSVAKNPGKKPGLIVFKFQTDNLKNLKVYLVNGEEVIGSN